MAGSNFIVEDLPGRTLCAAPLETLTSCAFLAGLAIFPIWIGVALLTLRFIKEICRRAQAFNALRAWEYVDASLGLNALEQFVLVPLVQRCVVDQGDDGQ